MGVRPRLPDPVPSGSLWMREKPYNLPLTRGLECSEPRVVDRDDWGHEDQERFVGSPTIRVDGRDISPPPADEAPSLSCRIYRLRDGRPSPTPDPADLRDALASVAARA